MKNLLKTNIALAGIYALLCFPLFYFVYKYSTPYLGMIDFFDYYKLYDTMDFRNADSPLNMRLVSSFFVYCMSKAGLIYNTVCQVDNAPFSKVIYFNAVFFNYICVVSTCVMVYHLARQAQHSVLLSFCGGLLYILGFGTIFFELMPLTDALAVFLFSAILYLYNKKSMLILVPLAILILQREYIFMAFGLYAFIDYLKYRQKYFLYTLITCIAFFAVYLVLRKCIFETSRYAYHTSSEFMLSAVTELKFPLLPFIRQTFMTLNLFLIYIFIIAYKALGRLTFNKYAFLKIMLLFAQLLVLTVILGLGNNAGRYFYILVPLIIIQMLEETKVFGLETAKYTEVGN